MTCSKYFDGIFVMNDYGLYHKSVVRVREGIDAAFDCCRRQGLRRLEFGHLLKGLAEKSPFISSQINVGMRITEGVLMKALKQYSTPGENIFPDKSKIEYSPDVENYLDTAQNNARNNGRQWADEMDFFYAFFLIRPNPLYEFLDKHNISYKRIFEKRMD